MAYPDELGTKIANAIWYSSSNFKDGQATSCGFAFANIAAFVAALIKKQGFEDSKDQNRIYEEVIQSAVSNPALRGCLVELNDSQLAPLAFELAASYSIDSLNEFALSYDATARFGRAVGEFSTPESVRGLALAILDLEPGDKVADLGCGMGSFLVDAYRSCDEIELYGVEIHRDAAMLTMVKTELLGANSEIVFGDMLENPSAGRFDKVFANYPFGMRVSFMRGEGEYYRALKTGKDGLGRPASAAWVFNKLAWDSLIAGGTAVVIMANGATFNGGDQQARSFFVNNGMIKAIVALPENLFPTTGIATTLMVMGSNEGGIRMVDASDLSIAGRRWDTMGADEIEEIKTRLKENGPFSRLVSREEIAAAEYGLYPSRYLGREIELVNPHPLGELAIEIERGASLRAQELDELTTEADTGFSFVRLSDIADGRISENLPHLRALDEKTEKQWLRTGDLVISKNGAPFKVAVAEIQEGQKVLANGNLYIVRFDTEALDPYFVAAFLASGDGKEMLSRMVVGTSIPNLPLRNLKEISIPVPDMAAQREVARRYQAHLDEIEVMKIKLDKARISASASYDEVMGR